MITCPSCNHQNEIDSSFCENCGHDLRDIGSPMKAAAMPPAGGGLTCSSCGYSNIPGAAFCENCGTPIEPGSLPVPPSGTPPIVPGQNMIPIICSSCGHQNVPGSKFCENCGKELKQVAPVNLPQVAPEPQPQVQPEPQPQVQPKPSSLQASESGEQLCPHCGFSNPAGTSFCGNCGMQLTEKPQTLPKSETVEPIPEPIPSQAPVPTPTGMVGRFEIKQSGASITVPTGNKEAIIGREDPVSGIFPEIDLDPHGGHDGGVGRRHAKLFVQDSQLMVEDQDSVNGTFVNRQKLNAFQPHPLNDGDELRLGKIILTYHAR